MNKIIMKTLADIIESLPRERFNMQYWSSTVVRYENPDASDNDKPYISYYRSNVGSEEQLSIHDCNTAGCIGGWAVAFANNMSISHLHDSDILYQGAHILDLEIEEARSLFFPDENSIWLKYRKELGLSTVCESEHERLYVYDSTGHIVKTVCAEYDGACDEYGGENCYCNSIIAMDSISNAAAAKLLRGIVNGEYVF